MYLQPTKELDYREAEKALRLYCITKGYHLPKTGFAGIRNWNRWDYTESPFWSAVADVYDGKSLKMTGFHINDNGEIIEIDIQQIR